ncbi:MAG: electron transport complex subunit RsxC [Clostridiales bacterium]|nr:electron transport complex subunit RsxC [Clostridiales bacterium]
MRSKTFKRGIKVPHSKQTSEQSLAECATPALVYIPLSQHIGKPAAPCVSVGDEVKAGTLVGEGDGFVSANVFSSVSGVVKSIENRRTVSGKRCAHVVIQNDGLYQTQYLPDIADRSPESLLQRIKDAGLVGMGGAGFPSHVKFSPKAQIDTFIINAAECEPYITCDYRLLVEHAKSVIIGAGYLAKTLGLDKVFFGVEDNKPKAIEILNATARELEKNIEVVPLASKYPQGAEKQLIYAVTGRKVPIGKLPADVGVVVGNAHTAFAMYEAVELNKPLYRRALTVCGDGVTVTANLWVRIGTLYADCVAFCGGVKDDCAKLISGGPMMGFALDSLDYSVTKTTGSILALSGGRANTQNPQPCINCAKCASVCPMRLMPMYIDAYTLRGDYKSAKKYGAESCMECGCCAYTCPAKRPIVQSVKLAKAKIKELNL